MACLVIAGGIAVAIGPIHAPQGSRGILVRSGLEHEGEARIAQNRAVLPQKPGTAVVRSVVTHRPHPNLWHAPRWWLPQAVCIHEHEGAWDANTGNGYYGGMQFTLYTWQSVGGKGLPFTASPREQLHRAWLVYRRDGNSWREWGTTGACGLR